ncbi:MAG TPA: hypothetical protein VFR32_05940, partial [Gaiellaceae bacterium]|nr:hypothetical protein [Gaiellaceae bacterium]
MAYQASGPLYPKPESGVLVKVVATFLGIAVAVLAILGIWLATSVDSGTTATPAEPQHSEAVATATPSYAGMAPENADAIATAHKPYPAAMPALQPGPVA